MTAAKPAYFQAGVKVIVVRPDGRLLLLRRSAMYARPHGWDFPGGGVDQGENPIAAAIRETKEETGLVLSQVVPLTIYMAKTNGDDDIIIGFSAQTTDEVVTVSPEHDHYEWLTADEAGALDLPELHRTVLDALRK